MANLSTTFFGMELKTPVVIGGSGLSNSIEKIKKLEESGAGAIVLKSIFEEEIYNEYQKEIESLAVGHHNIEYLDYFDYELKADKIKKYLQLISGAKKEGVSIPLVASINCTTGSDWVFFAKKLEEVGADALELNLFTMPSDVDRSSSAVREYYFKTVQKVLNTVNIPVGIKISPYFSNLGQIIKLLSESGLASVTLFNRFYNIDIDIDTQELVPAMILSHPFEYLQSLRWIGLMSDKVACPLGASTGIHDYQTALKMIMAGANAVQLVSGVYKHGYDFIKETVVGISNWMESNGYNSIDDFKGVASAKNVKNPANYERVQFMKYFGEYDQTV